MRARTRRWRSLLIGIVTSPLDAPRRSPQQRAMVTQRTDETNPGVCPPLPLTGPRLGRSLKRLGADRRHEDDVASVRLRQGWDGLDASRRASSTRSTARILVPVIKIRRAQLTVLTTAE